MEHGTKKIRSGSGVNRTIKQQESSAQNVIDPIRVIRQSIVLLIATGVVGLILGVGVFFVWNTYFPRYEGSVIFELNAELTSSSEASARENRNEDTVQRLAQTEARKAVGEDILEKVLRLRDVQKTSWAQSFFDDSGNFVIDLAYIDLDETISSGHVRDTQFFKISWYARNAADIPVILNAVAETYFEFRTEARAGMLNSVRSVFVAQKEILNDEIALAQTEIDDFIKTHDITTLDQGATALTRDLEDTTLKLNTTKQQLEMSRSRKRQVESKLLGRLEPSQDDILMAEKDPIVLRAEGSIQELRTELASAESKFSGEHNYVQTLNGKLSAAIRTKGDKVDEVVQRNLNSDLKTLSDEIESMSSLEKSLESDIDGMAVRLEEFTSYYNELKQKQSIMERLQLRLEGLEQTQLEIQAMKDRDDAEKVVLIQAASKPREKSWPKWYVVIPGTAVLSFGFVLGLVFLRELTDKRVKYASDVMGLPGARLLGMIPDLADDPTDASRVEMVVRDHPASIVAESFRQCYSSLLQSITEAEMHSIMVVGGLPESGGTSVTTNLALTAMASGRNVAIVDANFRRPRVADLMGINQEDAGLADLLTNDATLSEVMKQTQDGMKVITAGSSPNRVFERLNTKALTDVLDELKKETDIIFIDAPPMVVAGEALAIASRVDGTLLVARAYSEQKGLVARLIHQLSEQSSVFLGIILNRPRTTAGGYFRENFKAMASYSTRVEEPEFVEDKT